MLLEVSVSKPTLTLTRALMTVFIRDIKISHSVNQIQSISALGNALTTSHELGHNFGLQHVEDPGTIMYFWSGIGDTGLWSNSSVIDFDRLVNSTTVPCLLNPFNYSRLSGYDCGNGILEPGEQCDVGIDIVDDCCTSSCTFAPGCQCLDSDPCCTHGLFSPHGTVCRVALDPVCDVEEACMGNSSKCPFDDITLTGTGCGEDGRGGCFLGQCTFAFNDSSCPPAFPKYCDFPLDDRKCMLWCRAVDSNTCLWNGDYDVDGAPCDEGRQCSFGAVEATGLGCVSSASLHPPTPPTSSPSQSPSVPLTSFPSWSPTFSPTAIPTDSPSPFPSNSPTPPTTAAPTSAPTTLTPTKIPTREPTPVPFSLLITFPGDLGDLAATQVNFLKYEVIARVENLVGNNTVEDVKIESGSILAHVIFAPSVLQSDALPAVQTIYSIDIDDTLMNSTGVFLATTSWTTSTVVADIELEQEKAMSNYIIAGGVAAILSCAFAIGIVYATWRRSRNQNAKNNYDDCDNESPEFDLPELADGVGQESPRAYVSRIVRQISEAGSTSTDERSIKLKQAPPSVADTRRISAGSNSTHTQSVASTKWTLPGSSSISVSSSSSAFWFWITHYSSASVLRTEL